MSEEKVEPSPLEVAEARIKQAEERRKRRADAERLAHAERLALDLDAIAALEDTHGASNVAVIRVPYTAELPAAVACRCPRPAELKRYRDRTKPGQKDGRNREVEPDHNKATEEIAAACLLYPDAETFAKLCVARGGLQVQLGKEAIKLALGVEESEAKS